MADQLLHVFEYNQLPKVADVPGLELTGLHDVLCRQAISTRASAASSITS